MRFDSIFQAIEQECPLVYQLNYDNTGLIIPAVVENCTGALVALDLTMPVVQEAIQKGYNLVIVHHPLFFHPLKKFDASLFEHQVFKTCLQHDIAVYAWHTNLDQYRAGVSWRWAEQMNLKEIQFLHAQTQNWGFGVVGDLPDTLLELDFLSLLSKRCQTNYVRHSALLQKPIRKIAFCGGSGASFISQALAQQVDAYVTADLKYHDFSLANQKILLVDIGHYESERHTISLIVDFLIKKFPIFAASGTTVNTNFVHYFA